MYFKLVQTAEPALNWMTSYKLVFERAVEFSSDAVHVLVGVSILLSAAATLRTSIANWRPITIVVFAELCNEFLDLYYDIWPEQAMQIGESLKDLLLTLALPVLLTALTRLAPELFSPGKGDALSKRNQRPADDGAKL